MPRKVEPALIVVAMIFIALTVSKWPAELSVGRFILWLSIVFLLQTLLRDLYLYFRLKSNAVEQKEAQCFCVESGVGIVVLIIGIGLLIANIGGRISVSPIAWFLALTACLWFNFWMKDFVFSWNPWRVYRDPDHLNIVPRMRIK
ncbi:MAG: hypothetical protein KTR18_07780 [Acidiferrobacterales bacterium]|nr:hypothetical protein [Acidiferrobacterales bacterium]